MAVRGRTTAAGVTFDIANYGCFVLLSLTFIYPFWTIITQSFASIDSVHSIGFHVWPTEIDTEAWNYVFDEHPVAPAYFNTIFRVVFGVLLTLLVTFTAAYALSKPSLPWRKSITLIYTLTLFFTGAIIPLFLLVRSLGLFNTRAVLIMVPAINVFWIVLARNYLMTIDQAMEDSAVIDGASYWTVLWRIITPLAKPVIAVIALFSAVQHWNSWFDALIYAPHPRLTVLQMLVFRMLNDLRSAWFIEYQEMMRQAGIDVEMFAAEAVRAATIVLGMGPVFDAFGVNSVENYYDPEQDLTVREDTYSQSREALKTLQRWFQLGYLDQNLPSVSRAEWEQRWQNGLTGMWSRGQNCGTSARYGDQGGHCGLVAKNVPEAKLVTALPMIGPTGITRCPFDGRATPMNPGMGYSIKYDVTDEELARILQVFDYLNYDPQGLIHGQWGPPGLFYDWNGKEGADGTPYDCVNSWVTPKEGVSGYGQHYGFFYYNAYHWHDGFRFCTWNKDRNDLTEGMSWDSFMKQNPYIQEISTPDHREDIFTRTDYLPLWAEFGDGLTTLKQETWWRYITTDVDIDADWPRYVEEWMSLGGRDVLEELNEAPLVEDIRAGTAPWPSS